MAGSPSSLVSIVMPSLNQGRFIREAVASVLEQSHKNLELIVADGGSTDETLSILAEFHSRDKRLKWFTAKDNGPANALNRALSLVKGTLVGWLNSDDLYLPDALHKAVEALTANPDLLMIYGHGQHIDSAGTPLGRYPTLQPETPVQQFKDGCFICQPTVFFRRSMPLLLGPLDERLKTAFDFDYWVRAFMTFPGRIGFVDALLAYSRLHEDCITRRMRRIVAMESMQVLARHLGHAPGHWLLTYVEELLSSKTAADEIPDLRIHVESTIDEAAAWLTPGELDSLKRAVAKDTRLDQIGILEPKENEALAMEEFKAGVLKVRSTPRMLTLETTSRCNLRCVMCPHAINSVKRPKHLDDALVGRMSRFVRQAKSIQLHGIGEPLISPAFWSVLKFLPAHHQCESSINTNLTRLDEEKLEQLMNSNLKIINVSVDAARPETYRKIRGSSFEDVIGNIKRLIETRRALGKTFPLLYLNMTMMRSNIEEVPEFVDMAASLGADCVVLWHLNRWPEDEMARYVVERDGWVFDYGQEGLWNFPALSNTCLHRAEDMARKRGIRLYLDTNKSVYFEETEKALG